MLGALWVTQDCLIYNRRGMLVCGQFHHPLQTGMTGLEVRDSHKPRQPNFEGLGALSPVMLTRLPFTVTIYD